MLKVSRILKVAVTDDGTPEICHICGAPATAFNEIEDKYYCEPHLEQALGSGANMRDFLHA